MAVTAPLPTVIRGADWAVLWDDAAGGHRYHRSVDLAFTEDRVLHAGSRYDGPVGREIDGAGLMVMPGLVDIHSHPLSEPLNQGFLDETASPGLYQSSLYEFMPIHRPDAEGMRACCEKALAELLLSGVTTLVDLSVPYEGWEEIHARSGIRSVLAPMYRSGAWSTSNGHTVEYTWEADGGQAAFERALGVVDRAMADDSGRLTAMLAPSQIDTCTGELIRASKEAADARGIQMQIHAAQSVVEFQEITRRTGLTPVEWLGDLGVLDGQTILGHGIFLDDHPWVHWPRTGDLQRLAETGTAVAHCPLVFQRRGVTMRTFGRYLRAGVRMGIGTDTYPHNMLEEMRTAAYLSRVMSGYAADLTTGNVFHAATVGGAEIVGQPDIGRLAVGAKADLVLVDLTTPQMQPMRDPLKSLIYVAAERAVQDVFVGGKQVVADGRCPTLDHADAARRVTEAQARTQAEIPSRDFRGRTGWDVAPPVVPFAGEAP